MNQREKEAYLREYSLLKAKGKPFFPYAVAKDSVMASITLLSIIAMSIIFGAMAYLTSLGAAAGSPNEIDVQVGRQFEPGKLVAAQSGCLACHKIAHNGNDGPGPELTDIAEKLPKAAIRRTLENPTAPMPSYRNLPEEKKAALVDFLTQLRGPAGEEESTGVNEP